MSSWSFCNTTAETQKISEIPLSQHTTLNFHQLATIISFSTGSTAIALSLFLIWMHALHYTKPAEQKNIIRILLMVPIYSASNFLQLVYYHHAVYYAVISDCYEAFAISAFFSLMCQYMAPTLHEQKQFFRQLKPIQPWVWPLTWFSKCCGGDRGPWRVPKSGLTWFNIIWIGVYHYCFIRVSMTIVAVVTQHYELYCESSMSPLFSHVWVLVIESIAVAIAMYCVIQYYVQFKVALAYHKPGLKVVAIKGVIFLSFWQSEAISVASTQLNIIQVNAKLSYPDIATGIPAMLLSVEMMIFAIIHIWAYPWQVYREDAPQVFYPQPTPDKHPDRLNEPGPPKGGYGGFLAILDALNYWDVIKAFGRGLRWLFWGVKHRREDISYQKNAPLVDMDADGRSTYGMNQHGGSRVPPSTEEGAGLIAHAADPSNNPFRTYDEEEPYESDLGYRGAAGSYQQQTHLTKQQQQYPHAMSADEDDFPPEPEPRVNMSVMAGRDEEEAGYYPPHDRGMTGASQVWPPPPNDTQRTVGAALWGDNPHQHPGGPMI